MARSRRPSEQLASGEYERLLAAQGGHCALCPATPKTRRLHVDHDHQTGQVRGLLCFRCNRFLHSWMTVAWLLKAARYVGGTWEDFRDAAPPPGRLDPPAEWFLRAYAERYRGGR